MTVEELYKAALSVMPSNPSEDDSLRQYMVSWVNLLLMETLKYENAVRLCKGEDELAAAPRVIQLKDNVPYSPHLSENAFIWGIASFMAKDDEDVYHEQDYRGRYLSACIEYTPVVQRAIVDVYRSDYDA